MCVAAAPARFSSTILYAGQAQRDGRLVHVLGYENTVQNRAKPAPGRRLRRRSDVGNAMLLHFPAVEGSMTQMNVVDTESCPHILTDMVAAAFPVPASVDARPQSLTASPVEVFESGIYTIVLATDARAIPGALDQVPKPKRPALNDRLFDWYSQQFPGWPVALCCFANRDARHATPMLWWYEPRFPEYLFAPAIDSHTGGVPDLNRSVDVDHRVVFGIPGGGHGSRVEYSDRLAEPVRALLPSHVTGVTVRARLPNADFVASVDSLDRGVPTVDRRVLPAA